MKRLGFWLITFVAILGACWSIPRDRDNIPREYVWLTPPGDLNSSANIQAGRASFIDHCASCHGVLGDGKGTTQPKFGPPPADLTDRARMQARSPQYLFWRISEGGQVEPFRSEGSVMPAWKHQLSDEQRWQLVAFIQSLFR